MNIDIHCECNDCQLNKDGHCSSDTGIKLNNLGECLTFEPNDLWNFLDNDESENNNMHISKADFTIDKNEDFETIFHFFTRDSRCHSFNDDPPKTWKDVYKVYYSWSITQNMLGMDDEVVESEVLIDVVWDECSRLTDLSDCIRDMIYNKKENIYLAPLGQPASEWHIDRIANDTLLFTVWEDPRDTGYRFRLSDETAEEFAQFLDEVNQYMLEHGVGI